jgi:hypothetical protein
MGDRPTITFEDWLTLGIGYGYCSQPVCATHDGMPSTPEEDRAWEDGYDPCVPAVRLLNEAKTPGWGD